MILLFSCHKESRSIKWRRALIPQYNHTSRHRRHGQRSQQLVHCHTNRAPQEKSVSTIVQFYTTLYTHVECGPYKTRNRRPSSMFCLQIQPNLCWLVCLSVVPRPVQSTISSIAALLRRCCLQTKYITGDSVCIRNQSGVWLRSNKLLCNANADEQPIATYSSGRAFNNTLAGGYP